MDTPQNPGTPESAASVPAKPADSTPEAQHQPPATPAPQPGDSPRPDSGKPALSPEEQRVRDAQRMAHDKAGEAAETRKQNEALTAEINGLRTQLSSLVTDRRFTPHPVPDPVTFGDDTVEQLYKEYSAIPEGQEKQAFGVMISRTLDLAEQRMSNKAEREQADRGNRQKANELVKAVHQQISSVVQTQAPDVDLELFWSWAAPKAQAETPANLTDPVERWEWQTKRAVGIYRQRFGDPKLTPAADPNDPNAIRRSAAAVIGGGSLQPRGGQPSGKPRTMVDQMGERQSRILKGMQ